MTGRPWWWLHHQPEANDVLNERDEQHVVRVTTRRDITGETEAVWATLGSADQWDDTRWRPHS